MGIISGLTPVDKRKERAEIEALARVLAESLLSVPPPAVDWHKVKAECPHCQHVGTIAQDFGLRRLRSGEEKPQSWCRTCRNSMASHPGRFGPQR